MPRLLDISKICEDLKEVRSPKTFLRKKFHPNGLFSEQIFGPVKNYTCQCGDYHGAGGMESVCKICGVDITSSKERRRRFAKILLPIKIINPLYYDLITSIGGATVKKPLDKLMNSETSCLYVSLKDGEHYVTDEDTERFPNTKFKKYEKTEAIHELIKWLSDDLKDINEWKFVSKNLDAIFLDNVLVLPPDLRPISKVDSREFKMKAHTINSLYSHILNNSEIMRSSVVEISKSKSLYYTYFRYLQKDVNQLYEHIISKLSKKEGLIRENILGKRTDFSGRAVIVVDPTLKINECRLPYLMVLELFKLQISRKLVESGKFKFMNAAIEYVEKCIELSDTSLFRVCEQIVNSEVCILNRQPSLHRLNLLGFDINVDLDNVIKIHPLICSGYNADFDGDQMAVYLPITENSKNEAREKLFADSNLLSPTNASLTTTPSQDIVLGIYILTNDMIKSLSNKILYKGEKISEGQKIFNEVLPKDFSVVNYPVSKKELIEILNEISKTYPSSVTVAVLDKIKELGFKYSTLYGVSLSLDGFVLNKAKEHKNKIYDSGSVKDQAIAIGSDATKNFMRKNFKFSYFVDSGARGSWDQVRQIILSRGFVANFKGDVMQTPVKANLIEGLTPKEFFLSTYGCRKGLLDVAMNTGASGYLSRKLVFSCSNLQKHDELDDCGTTDYLEVYVDDMKKASMLQYRYFLDDNGKLSMITKDNAESIVGKKIRLRSPIFCKSDCICHKCYGDLYKILHSKFVGVVAAQALGEVGTQLVLRTFHSSGVAKVKDGESSEEETTDMRQSDIIGDLSTASKLLHINDKDTNCHKLVEDLYKVYSESKDIHHVHFESIVAQLMWVGYIKWRLHPRRDQVAPTFYSVQSVPEKESWILGLAFSNAKKNIVRGILRSGRYQGILDRILLGKIL